MNAGPECDRGQDGELVGGVVGIDVVGRVGLGDAGRLRLADRFIEADAGARHPAQHVVRGAVEDGGDPLDLIRHQVDLEGADEWDTAADRGLEVDVHVGGACQLQQPRSVLRHHQLVGRDNVLPGADRPLQVGPGRFLAAHHLHNQLDLGVVEDLVGAARGQPRRDRARPLQVPHQHPPQVQVDTRPLPDRVALGQQALRHLAAHGAQAEEADVQLHSRILSESWRLSSARAMSNG